jgi:hypothetical protein
VETFKRLVDDTAPIVAGFAKGSGCFAFIQSVNENHPQQKHLFIVQAQLFVQGAQFFRQFRVQVLRAGFFRQRGHVSGFRFKGRYQSPEQQNGLLLEVCS